MPARLNTIVQMYLNDTEFLAEGRDIARNRETSLPNLKRTILSFIDGTYNLNKFREQIDKALPAKDPWGARGPGFLMELNKLAKNHAVNVDGSKNAEAEITLRQILTDLKAENLGQRIEQFCTFLEQERTRFQQENRPRLTNVLPGNIALFISLFAHWIDWSGTRTIYYFSLLNGLKLLIDVEALQPPKGLRTKRDRILVYTEADHQRIVQVLNDLDKKAPQLQATTGAYWAERFLL